MDADAAPRKRRRPSALEKAAVGSLDIREALRAGSDRAAASSSTPLGELLAEQEAAFIAWSWDEASSALQAWEAAAIDAVPLLQEANLRLLPDDFRTAFNLHTAGDRASFRTAVLGALRAALAWWQAQTTLLAANRAS
ncbi:unnamed protein product [Symbiodinium natans]|uniref:Uncharacterized protein n=1 Tax=Symbiodinium natans TaxID=878477 RepID=A0A812PNH9_9DINO|nr:unnamed protein product [Symbiodinium natans]